MTARLDEKARQTLRSAKLYATKARIGILKVLMQAAGPLRQDQIGARLTSRTLNKATVYRTLESLRAAGVVHRVFMGNRACHFELADQCTEKQCHPHFTCTSCGVTHCLTDLTLPLAQIPRKGFVINRQQVRLEGLCPGCT